MSSNDRQEGGSHYKRDDGGEEHWDRVHRLGLDYFQACITKYVERCWKKDGLKDLRKARHFLDKYIELKTEPTKSIVIGAIEPLMGFATSSPVLGDILFSGPKTADLEGIKRTAFVGFTYEGGTATTDMFRCTSCREFITLTIGGDPRTSHTSCPGMTYTNQDRRCEASFIDSVLATCIRCNETFEAEAGKYPKDCLNPLVVSSKPEG